MATYDIIIKGGKVFDGTGKPGVISDVGVKGDEVVAIGNMTGADTLMTVDASGKYVSPGFIDITNHSDTHLTLFNYPHQESLVMQGVTTIIGGNCGASLAPLASPQAIQALSKWADISQISINWARVEEFLSEVDSFRPGVNFGTLVGYGIIRRGIMGDETRGFNTEELARAKVLLSSAMYEGAFGISFGLAYGHERASSTEEIINVSSSLKETGGVIKIHLQSEGAELVASINEAVRLGRETGVPIIISHLKAIGRKSWSLFKKALEILEHANSTGAQISFDVSPYNTTGSPLYLLLPVWARYGGFKDLFSRIDDPGQKQKIIEELELRTLHYDKILVVSAKIKDIIGKTIAQIAEAGDLSPEEALVDTVKSNDGRVSIIGRTVSIKNTDLGVKSNYSVIASDGMGISQDAVKKGELIHPRSFGTFPHFWHRYVHDNKTLSPEAALYKLTGGPAQKLGISRRGMLKEKNFADIAIFDPALFRDRATYHNPFKYASGIEWVIINGKVAVDNGRFMGVRSGKALRRT